MNTQERCNEVLDWEHAWLAYGRREARLNLESAAKVLSNSFIEHYANDRFPAAAAADWIHGDIVEQLRPPHRGELTIEYLKRVMKGNRRDDVFSALRNSRNLAGIGTFQREHIEGAMKHPEMKRLRARASKLVNHAISYSRKLEELEQSIHPRTIDTSDITDEQIDAAMAIYEPSLVRNKSENKVK